MKDRLCSKDVAELMEKRHDNLMRTIRTDIKNLETPDKYYRESTYKDGKGKERECYEVSYEGCQRLSKKLSDEEKEDFLTAVSLRVGKAGETANTKPEEVSEREYSIEEVAEILGISGRTVRRRIAAGDLKVETREYQQILVKEKSIITETELERYRKSLEG